MAVFSHGNRFQDGSFSKWMNQSPFQNQTSLPPGSMSNPQQVALADMLRSRANGTALAVDGMSPWPSPDAPVSYPQNPAFGRDYSAFARQQLPAMPEGLPSLSPEDLQLMSRFGQQTPPNASGAPQLSMEDVHALLSASGAKPLVSDVMRNAAGEQLMTQMMPNAPAQQSVSDRPLVSPGLTPVPPRPIGEIQSMSRDDSGDLNVDALRGMTPAELQALIDAGPARPAAGPQPNATQAHLDSRRASLEAMSPEELRARQHANPRSQNMVATDEEYSRLNPEQQGRVTSWIPGADRTTLLNQSLEGRNPKMSARHPDSGRLLENDFQIGGRDVSPQLAEDYQKRLAMTRGPNSSAYTMSPEEAAGLMAAGEQKFIDKKANDPYYGQLTQEKPGGSSIKTAQGYLPYSGKVGYNPAQLEVQYLQGKARGDENVLTPEELQIMQTFTGQRDARLAANAEKKEAARGRMQESALAKRYSRDLQQSGGPALAMAQMSMGGGQQQMAGGSLQPPDPRWAIANPQMYAAQMMNYKAQSDQQDKSLTREDALALQQWQAEQNNLNRANAVEVAKAGNKPNPIDLLPPDLQKLAVAQGSGLSPDVIAASQGRLTPAEEQSLSSEWDGHRTRTFGSRSIEAFVEQKLAEHYPQEKLKEWFDKVHPQPAEGLIGIGDPKMLDRSILDPGWIFGSDPKPLPWTQQPNAQQPVVQTPEDNANWTPKKNPSVRKPTSVPNPTNSGIPKSKDKKNR